jgi:hypothetical protein
MSDTQAAELRRAVVVRLSSGEQITAVAADTGISRSTLVGLTIRNLPAGAQFQQFSKRSVPEFRGSASEASRLPVNRRIRLGRIRRAIGAVMMRS